MKKMAMMGPAPCEMVDEKPAATPTSTPSQWAGRYTLVGYQMFLMMSKTVSASAVAPIEARSILSEMLETNIIPRAIPARAPTMGNLIKARFQVFRKKERVRKSAKISNGKIIPIA